MDVFLSSSQLLPFVAASVLLTLAPGPDNLLVLALGMARGRRQGVAFGLGCAAGCLNHTALAALGVGALIVASDLAFGALRVAGGLYLIWLGVQAIRHAAPADAQRLSIPADSCARLFRRGLLASAINPKVVLFFLAFLPQFVQAADRRFCRCLGRTAGPASCRCDVAGSSCRRTVPAAGAASPERALIAMECRPGCGACCVAPSISSLKKPAGQHCAHLDDQ
ncbi:MAG: LysE family translocator, partial [Dechloromonas sp.]|nr:LysE family translocator [Dechloromonas sp.]